MHGWLFEDIYVVKLEALVMLANDPLKFNKAIDICLINLIKILYLVLFFFVKYIYEYPKYCYY